jgi:hypothetical protein
MRVIRCHGSSFCLSGLSSRPDTRANGPRIRLAADKAIIPPRVRPPQAIPPPAEEKLENYRRPASIRACFSDWVMQ